MASENTLTLEQTTGMHLSPMQLRFARLLELNTPEVEEAVARELEENPALEVSDKIEENTPVPYPVYRQTPQDDLPPFTPVDDEESLYDHLYAQLAEKNLSPHIEEAAKYIIGNLDSNGYLDRSIEDIADDMAFNEGLDISYEDARLALEAVRSLDPPGIAAFNLRDTLLMQLDTLPESEARNNAVNILTKAYDAFMMKHKNRIITTLRLPEENVDRALDLIRSLNPRPGASFGWSRADKAAVIVPDFTVSADGDTLSVSLNSRIPDLTVSLAFSQAIEDMGSSRENRKNGDEYIIRNYNEARDFINILAERRKTMLAVMTAIVDLQRDYFLTRDVYALRPMMIKNVAAVTGLDFSVISRATNGKYVATPWGVFPLRFFFSDAVGDSDGGTDALTNRKIEQEIRRLVGSEDKKHPLSDQRISDIMTGEGFDISRRTVAKYRDRLRIPVARLRKEM